MKRSSEFRFRIADGGRSVAVALLVTAAGCGGQQGGGDAGGWAISVRTAEARRQPVEERIALVATVRANESVDVKSEIEGTVAEVNFEEGRPVKKGQLLVKLDTQKLEATLASAEAAFDLAKANRERAESMLANRTISQQEFDQATARFASDRAMLDLMKQQLKDAAISAPFDGIAGARHVSPGQVISPDVVLTTLVDLEPVKIEFRAPERLMGELKTGQTIAFRVAAYPGEEFRGEVYFIDPQVDLETRTVLVKALEPNAGGRLRPGMFGNLDLILQVKPDAVMVPEAALIADGDRTYLYRVSTNGAAEQVDVAVGLRQAGQVEIATGLNGGESVIVEGTQKVQPGMPVTPQPVDAPAAPAAEVPPAAG